VADDFSRKIEMSRQRLGPPPSQPPENSMLPPVAPARAQLTNAEQAERIIKFCDSFSRLFAPELCANFMSAKDVRQCLVSHLRKQVCEVGWGCGSLGTLFCGASLEEFDHLTRVNCLRLQERTVQTQMHFIINDAVERGISDSHKINLKPFWVAIDTL
jgi:hypothetical protein